MLLISVRWNLFLSFESFAVCFVFCFSSGFFAIFGPFEVVKCVFKRIKIGFLHPRTHTMWEMRFCARYRPSDWFDQRRQRKTQKNGEQFGVAMSFFVCSDFDLEPWRGTIASNQRTRNGRVCNEILLQWESLLLFLFFFLSCVLWGKAIDIIVILRSVKCAKCASQKIDIANCDSNLILLWNRNSFFSSMCNNLALLPCHGQSAA